MTRRIAPDLGHCQLGDDQHTVGLQLIGATNRVAACRCPDIASVETQRNPRAIHKRAVDAPSETDADQNCRPSRSAARTSPSPDPASPGPQAAVITMTATRITNTRRIDLMIV